MPASLIIMAGLYLIDGRMPSATWIQVLYYSFAASMLGLALTYFYQCRAGIL